MFIYITMLFKDLFSCTWVFCLHECIVPCVPDAHGGLKRLSPLELELPVSMNYHVDAGN